MLLAASGVERDFGGRPVLRGVDLVVHRGDRIGIVGPNGCGKTTLLRILSGLDLPDRGLVRTASGIRVGYLSQQAGDGLFASGGAAGTDGQAGDAGTAGTAGASGVVEAGAGLTLHAYLLQAFESLEQMRRELAELERAMSEASPPGTEAGAAPAAGAGELSEIVERYGRLRDAFELAGGYDFEARLKEVASGLGFRQQDLERELGSFSGGERVRAALARLLLESPDVLLLDEPTNHLDLAATEWLEGYLKGLRQAALIVSHDRFLLDAVATRILDLEGGGGVLYGGGFSEFERVRAQRQAQALKESERRQEEMARLEDYVRRYKAGNRSTQAKSREKRLERLRAEEERERENLELSYGTGPRVLRFGAASPGQGSSLRSPLQVLRLGGVCKRYGERTLFEGLNLTVERQDRLGIIGPNGCGKTTLLRLMAGLAVPDQGWVLPGADVRIGYFAQEATGLAGEAGLAGATGAASRAAAGAAGAGAAGAASGAATTGAGAAGGEGTVLEAFVWRTGFDLPGARQHLARFGFRGEDVFQPVEALSGGERNRLRLAVLLATGPYDLLLLDEPTNHLDLTARAALEAWLGAFEGAVVVVSHDRYFLDRVVQRLAVFEVGSPAVLHFEGNYSAYRAAGAAAAGSEAAAFPANPSKPAATGGSARRRPGTSTRLAPWERRRMGERLQQVEARIAELEAFREELERRLASAGTYRDGEQARQIVAAHSSATQELQSLYQEWEELATRLEEDAAATGPAK